LADRNFFPVAPLDLTGTECFWGNGLGIGGAEATPETVFEREPAPPFLLAAIPPELSLVS
jgi:hypothetical protein